jgi:hypothetical protein
LSVLTNYTILPDISSRISRLWWELVALPNRTCNWWVFLTAFQRSITFV